MIPAAAADDDAWVRAALTDDNLVVDLLIRLHDAPPRRPAVVLPLEWSVRQRRSKSISVSARKPAHRGSPTTPLSWSGGGSEGSTRQPTSEPKKTARSKVNPDNEKTSSKRTRKKKTLAELKDEEHSLWKERKELKREIAALRLNLEMQRATNEQLKRMKIELQPGVDRGSMPAHKESISGYSQDVPPIEHPLIALQSSTSNAQHTKFAIPDLNVPFDGPCSEMICGIS